MVSPFVRLLPSLPSSSLPSLRSPTFYLATPTSSLRYLFSSEGSGYRHLYWAETRLPPENALPTPLPLAHQSQVEIGLCLIQKVCINWKENSYSLWEMPALVWIGTCESNHHDNIHTCVHTHMHTRTTCTHTCAHMHTHTYMHAHTHTCMHTHMHACTHTYMHAHTIHACTHTCTHTHNTHMHTYTGPSNHI